MGIKVFNVVIRIDSLGVNQDKNLCGENIVSIKASNGEKIYM